MEISSRLTPSSPNASEQHTGNRKDNNNGEKENADHTLHLLENEIPVSEMTDISDVI